MAIKVPGMANARNIDLDKARKEIAYLETILLAQKFEIIGWLPSVINIGNKTIPVPQTVLEAYKAFKKNEKKDPLKALAQYYAHFSVAMRPEHDHPSRHEDTRQFYKALAARNGRDIFPDHEESANLFDELLAAETKALIIQKSPDQKEYLEFQEKIQVEIKNIQAMVNHFKNLEASLQDEKNAPLAEGIQLLGRVLDRMRMAELREDLHLYSEDAKLVLNSLAPLANDLNIENEIKQLQQSVTQFESHHTMLMKDLKDKKNALYISSALKGFAAALTSPVGNVIPTPHVLAKLKHSDAIVNSMQSVAGRGMEGLAEQKLQAVDEAAAAANSEDSLVHNIYQVDRATSLSDKYVLLKQSLRKALDAAKNDNETQAQLAFTALCTVTALAAPLIAIPVGLTSLTKELGELALEHYDKNKQLKELEEQGSLQKKEHLQEMHSYLSQHSPEEAGKIYLRAAAPKSIGFFHENRDRNKLQEARKDQNQAAAVSKKLK